MVVQGRQSINLFHFLLNLPTEILVKLPFVLLLIFLGLDLHVVELPHIQAVVVHVRFMVRPLDVILDDILQCHHVPGIVLLCLDMARSSLLDTSLAVIKLGDIHSWFQGLRSLLCMLWRRIKKAHALMIDWRKGSSGLQNHRCILPVIAVSVRLSIVTITSRICKNFRINLYWLQIVCHDKSGLSCLLSR